MEHEQELSIAALQQRLAASSSFAIYAAGEFASVLVQCCARWGVAEKIDCCVVTKRDSVTPEHILGVPVLELAEAELTKETLVVVAVLSPKAQRAIAVTLASQGHADVLLLPPRFFRVLNAELADYSASARDFLYKCMGGLSRQMTAQFQVLEAQNREIIEQNRKLRLVVEAMPLVVATHTKTFGPYKGAFRGRSVVICGTGPTLTRYAMNDRHVHIGLNSIIFKEDMAPKLDFYFCQDYPSKGQHPGDATFEAAVAELEAKHIAGIADLHCVRFIGHNLGDLWRLSVPYDEMERRGYQRYFNLPDESYRFYPDIRYACLHGGGSVIFSALQFALFGMPNRIYLVGCDGYAYKKKNYYEEKQSDFANANDEYKTSEERIQFLNEVFRNRYHELQEFVTYSYPHTEIIMVNPKYYGGIFRETVTDAAGNIVEM